ncbi:hypothetical protein I4I73_31305 [Pseudonocardia sp. KRD-184]|uniref:Uncharacterized protein n=1 Tax=Pseudonocardia oceani TaxID=2792013 RepID=A0ABS6U558_9PSEU|nr:hypothetical protein [Pseudonocardia oceani]MBW0093900.1 hypothetical protein [Pseudonocardia oceani]MBW0100472.1 hypothetical protein [Pseudonocardia oceani]MBW0113277.1 hypothetical protein [Pseudonocardia oceani]MBW0125687.1 hypothetical protein [Pseudonocardia oceani]MBW0127375.1 hypothetical protein [Pseudonocardia oceani]
MSTLGTTGNRTPVYYVLLVLAWLWVVVPFGYGLYQLIVKIPALFAG